MSKQIINSKNISVLTILFVSVLLWNCQHPSELTINAWHTFVIFISTIVGLILNPFPMGVMTLLALVSCIVTSAIPMKTALSGFSESVVWLVVFAFFIARTVINTGLGTRIAYLFISRFGKSPIGVAYSMIFTEFLISPMIPSATSRGGGIIYPIAKATIEGYNSQLSHINQRSIGGFFTMICLHSNIITSTMFLTAMAGNPVAQKLAIDCGVDITWFNWAYAAVVPGLVSLILLPFIIQIFCPIPKSLDNQIIVEKAKEGLIALGKMTRNEIITACTFVFLIMLWIFEKQVGISATTTAMLGVCILLLSGVLTWPDITSEKSAWDIFIWFAILMMIANSLSEQKVTLWAGNLISSSLNGYTPTMTAVIVCVGLFFGHYLFASVTVYFTAMYGIFLKTFLSIGLPALPSAYALMIVIMISSGFTHYGISSAPVFFSGGYLTVKEWWSKSFCITIGTSIIWMIMCVAWWSVIGWL
jgi:DASS family divalent anion:Na+ symporter